MKANPILPRLRKLCLSLPATTEVKAWGHPTFRVNGKIFVGYGDKTTQKLGGLTNRVETLPTIGVKVGKARQKELLRDPRFAYADYVGRFGWVTMTLKGRIDWNEIAGLVLTSYRLIAPKKLLLRMDRKPSGPRKKRKPAAT
ncbi:MAG TPA: MmcQ/YjbR family DNA-binding protein [Phycisphaerae bacterium]|nr:MmcQ/YjbR family DNA-binding protein [Phycisphaerae bacterium]